MLIVHTDTTGFVYVTRPTLEALRDHSLETIALKDVPEGYPFWLVGEAEIPTDRTFRNAWEVPEDWGPPDGYGSRFNTFEEIEDAQDKQ
ncbi:MAG: hypothetical protein AB7C91_13655 [Sphaerochaeta sp.]|uniref:hypothetical protein n=1 Tax=Sphaerochaeta sp. TaxID=1972642 RepID=UPI003D10D828